MEISQASLEEFRAIYKEEFGQDCTLEEAREMASRLLMLFEGLAKWEAKQLPPEEN